MRNASGGNYGNAAGGALRLRAMLFPPPWFSPLGTPLSEAPPFKRKSARGENPSRLRRRYAGGHSTALFRFSVAALHLNAFRIRRIRRPGTRSGLGGRHHSAALPIPPTPQGSRPHRPFYELSPVCPASCFWGATNRRCAPWKRPALRSLAMKNRMRC